MLSKPGLNGPNKVIAKVLHYLLPQSDDTFTETPGTDTGKVEVLGPLSAG